MIILHMVRAYLFVILTGCVVMAVLGIVSLSVLIIFSHLPVVVPDRAVVSGKQEWREEEAIFIHLTPKGVSVRDW